ncbi:MAG: hypothetical protein P8Y34_03385 [Anaerolineales bacterium]
MAAEIYAVLTGDIVSSSRINQERGNRVLEEILSIEKDIKGRFPSSVHAGVDVFRGDSWQLVVRDPISALRIGLYFRAQLRSTAGMDSRVSIGFGTVDYLPAGEVSTGTGAAYTLSGMGLKDLLKPVRMKLKFTSEQTSSLARSLDTITGLMDLQVQRWTRKQAAASAGSLVGLTQEQIALNWKEEPVSQQAISQHLESAGWYQIRESLQFVETVLPEVLNLRS